ncbi:MAG: DUF4367 domain-containing protein [Clostridiaceae bacterium]|jgi:hypothetical protein|nr:DUF4367 domain-containing protein [Clostridiaceae bacterium]
MKKLWKSGLLSLLTIGLLVSTAGAVGGTRSGLDIEQRVNGFFFQARTNRPERQSLILECRLSWLPEDFEQQKAQLYEYSYSVFYTDQEGKRTIQFEQLTESSSILLQSRKGDKLERVMVKGKPGGLIRLVEGKEDLNLIWYDTEAESYFSMLTHGLTEEELFRAAESVDVRNKFHSPVFAETGLICDCNRGSFQPASMAKLAKTIDRDSPNQRGTRWIYSYLYQCNSCQMMLYRHVPAIPVE